MRRSLGITFLLSFIALGTVACYPPALQKADPPAGEGGIRVTLAGQDCDAAGLDGDGVGMHSLALKLHIDNPTHEPLRFDPTKTDLRGRVQPRAPMSPTEPIVVAPGQRTDVVLRYHHQRECTTEFQLGLEHAFQLGGRDTKIADLSFRPY